MQSDYENSVQPSNITRHGVSSTEEKLALGVLQIMTLLLSWRRSDELTIIEKIMMTVAAGH